MKKFTYVLAIDPGGTKCAALLAKADGTLLAQCRLRDWATGGRHPQIMRRAIEQVLRRHPPAPLRIVACGGRYWWRYLPPAWRGLTHARQDTELFAALATTGHTFGMVVIAGTGARVSVCTRAGKIHTLDGLGPVLGDGGSGYAIGRETLRAVARSLQLRQPATRLRRRVLRACGCRDLGDLTVFSLQPRDRSRIASLTTIVNEEANAGDPLARRLLRDGAAELAGSVRELVHHLGLAKEDLPFVGAGSVAVHSDIFWRELCRQIRQIAPGFRPRRAPLPPVAGLAALGLADATAIKKLFSTVKKERRS